jgi:hypothetical protein
MTAEPSAISKTESPAEDQGSAGLQRRIWRQSSRPIAPRRR